MENLTATQIRDRDHFRLNLREYKAKQLASAVMKELSDLIPDRCRNEAWDRLVGLFAMKGAEILTDYDREQAGLSPRGPEGYTVDELIAIERRRLAVLATPPSMIIPKL